MLASPLKFGPFTLLRGALPEYAARLVVAECRSFESKYLQTEIRPADRGYSYPSVRRALTKRGIRAVIPRRSDQYLSDCRHRFDIALYTQRNRVERLVGRLKEFRRVATRFEKRAVHFLAMVTLAAVPLWL